MNLSNLFLSYYLFENFMYIIWKLLIISFYYLARKLSPTAPANRLTIENSVEKDEGISDEEDPAELRILLELNEQVCPVYSLYIHKYFFFLIKILKYFYYIGGIGS